MIRLSEITEFNIFTALQTVNPELEIFKYVDGETLDIYFLNSYSNRYILDKYANMDVATIAKILNALYSETWNNATVSIANMQMNLNGELNTKTTVESGKDVNTINDVNSVSAFNDENFVNNDKNETTNTTEYGKKVEETYNYISGKNIDSTTMQILTLNVIRDIIVIDVLHLVATAYIANESEG